MRVFCVSAAVAGGGVVLNQELIRARLAESARAASYLAEIFIDDDAGVFTAVSSADQVAVSENQQVARLDAAHSALLGRLVSQPSWTRDDFDQIARDLDLLPSGALEALNEAAFETVGEPVCEGSETDLGAVVVRQPKTRRSRKIKMSRELRPYILSPGQNW